MLKRTYFETMTREPILLLPHFPNANAKTNSEATLQYVLVYAAKHDADFLYVTTAIRMYDMIASFPVQVQLRSLSLIHI